MSSIDEIFKKYDALIASQNRKNAEQLINKYFLLIKDSFLEFYGEARREQIEAKFENIYFSCGIYYFDMLKTDMMSDFNDYLKNKYGYSMYDNASSLVAGEGYAKDYSEINERMKPYIELSEKYSNGSKKIQEKAHQEMNAELINAINQILLSDLHYTEDMLLTTDDASKYDWFNNLINLNNPKWFLINFQTVIAGLRNMGVQIPISELENKRPSEFTQADYDAVKNLYEKILADESIKKFIPSRDVIKKNNDY